MRPRLKLTHALAVAATHWDPKPKPKPEPEPDSDLETHGFTQSNQLAEFGLRARK